MQTVEEIPAVDALLHGDTSALLLQINDRLKVIALNFMSLDVNGVPRTVNPAVQPINPYNNVNPIVSVFEFLDPLYSRLRTAALQVREVQVMPNAIGQNQLQIDSVIARHIVAGTITADKLDVDQLSAITGNIGTITAGNITLDTSGFIRGGATGYNTGVGFWMGYDSGAYKFFIGTSAGNKLLWDGTNLTLTGAITATTGSIGGFDIGVDYIRDVANTMGLASTVTGGDDVRFWAGATFAGRATAPFRVTKSGALVASSATIIGTVSGRLTSVLANAIDASGILVTDLINARLDTSAKTMLAGFTFGTTDYAGALKAGTITWNTTTGAITGGSGVLVYRGGIIGANAGVPTFTLDASTGNATFAGTLSAPSGTIGGFTIGATTLTSVSGTNTLTLAAASGGGGYMRVEYNATQSAVFDASGVAVDGGALGSAILGNYSGSVKFELINSIGVPTVIAIASTGDLSIAGSFSVGGGQIFFPAVQKPSSNVNCLDDYAEGTWTPSIGGTATYTTQTARYTKIGRLVTLECRIKINVIGTGSINQLSGLPFTPNTDVAGSVGYFANLATSVYSLGCYASPSGNITFTGLTALGASVINGVTVFQNGADIMLSISYTV